MKKLLAGLIAVSMFGCGTDALRPVGQEGEVARPATPEANGPMAPATPPGGGERGDVASTIATLKLKGVDPEAYSALLVRVGEARVLVDGRPVDVTLSEGFLDLAREGHAFTVGTFALPVDAEQVEVELVLTDLGSFASDAVAGAVDLGIPPLQFDAPASSFREHAHAVVHLSLSRSLKAFEGEEGLLLLPDFQVHY